MTWWSVMIWWSPPSLSKSWHLSSSMMRWEIGGMIFSNFNFLNTYKHLRLCQLKTHSYFILDIAQILACTQFGQFVTAKCFFLHREQIILIVGSDAKYGDFDDEFCRKCPKNYVHSLWVRTCFYDYGDKLRGFTWIRKNFWASLFSEAICLIRSLFFSSTFMVIIFLSYSDHSPSCWRKIDDICKCVPTSFLHKRFL